MKRTAIIAFLTVALSLQTTRAKEPEPIDSPVLQFAIETQWELYQEVPLNRVPFFAAHNSYANRGYSLSTRGYALLVSALAGATLAPFWAAIGIPIADLLLGIRHPGDAGSVLKNQTLSLTQLLDAGVRNFELDLHLEDDQLALCHSKAESCDHATGQDFPLNELFKLIKNPRYDLADAINTFRFWLKLPQYSNQLLVLSVENFVGKGCKGVEGEWVPCDDINRDKNAMVSDYIRRHFGSLIFTPGDLRNWRISKGYTLEADPDYCVESNLQGHFPTVREVIGMGRRVILQEDHYNIFIDQACRGEGVRFPRFGTLDYNAFASEIDCVCNPARRIACPASEPSPGATAYLFYEDCHTESFEQWTKRHPGILAFPIPGVPARLRDPALPAGFAQVCSDRPDGDWVEQETLGCERGRELSLDERLFLQGVNGDNERLCAAGSHGKVCHEFSGKTGKIARPEANFLTLYNAPVVNPDMVTRDVAYGTMWTFRGPTEPINAAGTNRCVFIDTNGNWQNDDCSTPRKRVCKNVTALQEFDAVDFVLTGVGEECAASPGDTANDPPRTPEQNQKVQRRLEEYLASVHPGDDHPNEAWIRWDVCAVKGCFAQPIPAHRPETPTGQVHRDERFVNVRNGAAADYCVFTHDEFGVSGMECYPVGEKTDTPVLKYVSQVQDPEEFGRPEDRLFMDLNGDARTDLCLAIRNTKFKEPAVLYCYLVVPDAASPGMLTMKRQHPGILLNQGDFPGSGPDRLLASELVSTGPGGLGREFCNVWFTSRTAGADKWGEIQLACTAIVTASDGTVTGTRKPSVFYKQRFGPFKHNQVTITAGLLGENAEALAAAFTDVNGDAITDLCLVVVQAYRTNSEGELINKARQNICLAGTARGFQPNNLVISEVYTDGNAVSPELGGGGQPGGGGGRWVDFNADGLADLCLVTIGSPSDNPNIQFPVVRCEPAFRMVTGRVVFRSVPTVSGGKMPETFYMIPEGYSVTYYQGMFNPFQNLILRDASFRYSLHAGDINGDKASDFCIVGAIARVGGTEGYDYVSCMFSQPGLADLRLPVVPRAELLNNSIYGTQARLKGPLQAKFDNFDDTVSTRGFVNINGDGTMDYCIGGELQLAGGDERRGRCWAYFH